ncbi:MAG: hypothetical protein SH857_06600 [Chitinophagales bacterium]|nr:hypothetical protein [Chitinophagales bacterium]
MSELTSSTRYRHQLLVLLAYKDSNWPQSSGEVNNFDKHLRMY